MEFFYIIQNIYCPELKFENIIHLWSIFVVLWGLKINILTN